MNEIDWLRKIKSGGNLQTTSSQRLAKWRTIFAGWQLGTRDKAEPPVSGSTRSSGADDDSKGVSRDN